MSRLWVCLGLFAVMVLCTVARAGLPAEINQGQPVDLTVFRLPRPEQTFDISRKAELEVARAFMKRYPNVHLHSFAFLKPPAEQGSGDSDILMAMAGGVAPDVMVVNFRQSDTYISQGFLLPLDEYIQKWENEPGGKAELQRIIPSPELWKVIRRKGPDGQQHIWCIPPIIFSATLTYRKDLMRNAGLDANHPPQSWDELFNMGLQICDPRKGIYALTNMDSYSLITFLWSAGSEILRQNPETEEWYAAYDDAGAVQACQFYWKMTSQPWGICPRCGDHFTFVPGAGAGRCAHGHSNTVADLKKQQLFFTGITTDTWDAAKQGKVAFSIGYLGDVRLDLSGSMDPNISGIAPVPMGPTGLRGNELNSSMLGINGTITDPAKIQAAWAYIRFTASEEAKRIQTKVMVDGGFAKCVNPTWLRRFGYTEHLREVPPGWEETYAAALKNGHPEPYGKNAQQIYAEMDLAWDKIKLLEKPDTVIISSLLKENVVRTNERLIGYVAPAERVKRNRVALVVVLGCAILFGLLIRFTLSTYGATLADEGGKGAANRRRMALAFLILAPAIIGVFLFQYVPLIRGSIIAFQDYTLLGQRPFVGVANFGAVLFAPEFWHALSISLRFALLYLSLGFFAPMILALLLHEIPRGSLFFRIIFFLPAVTSGVTIMLLWRLLYDPTPYGMLNQILARFGIENQLFLQDPNLAMLWVIVPLVWAHVGPGCIIYLAALKQIPEDYYEAADVDGAGFFTKFRTITIPYLKPLLIINFVGACIAAFKLFEPVWIMTAGGPAGSTNVLGLEIWRNAFMYLKYSYATAQGWMLASLLIGFTIFQLRYLSKVQFRLAKSE